MKSMASKEMNEKLIKRDYSQLCIREDWYWVYIPESGEEIKVISRTLSKPDFVKVFENRKNVIVKHKKTGVYIISSEPHDKNDKPVCYYKTQPLYFPLAICGLPENLDLESFEPLPLNTVLSSLEAIRIENSSELKNKIFFEL